MLDAQSAASYELLAEDEGHCDEPADLRSGPWTDRNSLGGLLGGGPWEGRGQPYPRSSRLAEGSGE
jgi:hypothetical protein